MVKSGTSKELPYVSTSWVFSGEDFRGAVSSEAREDKEVDEGEDLGLSRGEMFAEEAGVESAVANRRRTASEGSAEVVMVREEECP